MKTRTRRPSFVRRARFERRARRIAVALLLLSFVALALNASGAAAPAVPSPAPPPPNCAAPGVQVSTDPPGDQFAPEAGPATQQQDIVSISLAEEYDSFGRGTLVATIKLAALDPNALPSNGNWYTFFTARHADNSETAYFVSANTNELGQISYDYGHVNGTTNVGNGVADSGSVSAAAKTITIRLALEKLRKPVPGTPFPTLTGDLVDLSAGKTFTNVYGQTSILLGSNSTPVVSGGLLQDVDESAPGSYTFAGAAACAPEATPTPTPTGTPTPTPTPGGEEPATCKAPGTQATADPAGDQQGGPAGQNQALDIRSISVAEPLYTNSAGDRINKLTFTIRVERLTSPLPANNIWRALWAFGGATYHVSMLTDGSGVPRYEYGTVATGISTLGGADAGQVDAAAGTISITINSGKVGNPQAGAALTSVNGTTALNVSGTLFPPMDTTGNGSYTLVGNASCVAVQEPDSGATYIKGGIQFSPSYPTHAPGTVRDGEPSVRVDKFGNAYVAGIRGVPAGNDLWYFDLRPTVNGQPNPNYDPLMRNPQYRGQPDAFTGEGQPSLLADGGGDVDLAVTFPEGDTEDPNNPPTLAFTSLALANISTATSKDRGVTFQKNPAGNVTGGLPIDDRQWFEAVGPNTVYMIYRTAAPAVSMIQRSTDGGLTWGPARTAGPIGQVGSVDVHKATGTVYLSGSSGQVCVGTPVSPLEEPLTYTCKQAAPGNANLFFVVKVADDGTPNGTAYVNYSDGRNIFIAYSTDKGQTWSAPVRVNDGPETKVSLFPWMETGPAPGTIGVVWYGTDSAVNNNDANWRVFYAHVTGANTQAPVIRQVQAGDHVIHASNISLSGLNPLATNVNRNLIDYFQVAFDPTGAAVIAFTDDHNDYDGNTFVTRQVGGPGINGADVPAPVEGSALPAPRAISADGSQVVDPPRDARTSTTILRTNEPIDITSIKYSAEPGAGGDPVLVARMKISDLSVVPPLTTWRMNFAANAPDSVMSPTGQFTFGVADRGDQFYLAAQTDAAGAQTFRFGTLARNGNGGLDYTDRGAADSGSIDTAAGTVTVKVSLSKLNPFVKAGNAPLATGTVLTGLRGSASISAQGNAARSDSTRGGTQYTITLPRGNVALAANGATAVASTVYPSGNFGAATAIDGVRTGLNWGAGGGWNDATRGLYPDTLEVRFNSAKTINEVRVYTLQNDYGSGLEPTDATPASVYGLLDFDVQYWDGDSWETVPGGAVTGNDRARRAFTFADVTTNRIRVLVRNAREFYSRVVEVEAFGY